MSAPVPSERPDAVQAEESERGLGRSSTPGSGSGAVGVLCALPEELGGLADDPGVERRRVGGVELFARTLGGQQVLACVGGVGKVRAAQGATALLAGGATRALLVVGVAGGLTAGLEPGVLVHCTRTVQADSALRHDREYEADADLLALWRAQVAGAVGWFLTADRPVMSRWRRLRLSRAFRGPAVADMETAAAAAVARSAGVPWAALRAVTDRATGGGFVSFRRHFPAQAGRAAATLEALVAALGRAPARDVSARDGSERAVSSRVDPER